MWASMKFLPFDMIVEETNCYAKQCTAQKPDPKW